MVEEDSQTEADEEVPEVVSLREAEEVVLVTEVRAILHPDQMDKS